MNFRILKKDLKRKKTINLILLVFIILASAFISVSLYNLIVTISGIDNYMRLAKMPDYIILTMSGNVNEESQNDIKGREFIKNQDTVERYAIDEILWTSGTNYELKNGEKMVLNSSAMITSFDIEQQKFFDESNQEITCMDDGTIYICRKILNDNKNIKTGDTIYLITENGYRKEFKIAGFVKDAFLGAEMVGANRFIVSRHDYEEVREKSGLLAGKLFSVWTSDLGSFTNELNKSSFNMVFDVDQKEIKTCYIMDMIMAVILLLVSVCLIVISVLMLRFTIIFTINEDYKEIGIMKAIGMKDSSIRSLYMGKYLLISFVGAAIGFAAGIFISGVLMEKVAANIVIETSDKNIIFQMFSSLVLVIIVALFAYLTTGKIKHFTPMDAIRSGSNGERFSKKGFFNLSGFGKRPTAFMAVNDVVSEWKKYIVLLLTNVAGIWMVIMLINTINTLSSDKIIDWFSMQDCDFYVSDGGTITELLSYGDRQVLEDYLTDLKEALEKDGVEVENSFIEVMFRFNIRFGENVYSSSAYQGIGADTDDYMYTKGTAPKYKNEVAITHLVSERTGAGIGDTVYIMNGDKEEPFIVTAIFQSMNNMGEGIRFSENADLNYTALAGAFGVQFILKDELSEEDLIKIEDILRKIYPDAEILTAKEYIGTMIGGITEQLAGFKILILAVVIIINILVVVLMQKLFLIRERGEMGLLKAIGFKNSSIIGWQTKRIMIVLFAGILIGTLTATPFSQITSGEIFKIMGASKIEFVINPFEVYFIYPVMIFVATVFACVIVMLKVKDISAKEINELE